MRQFQYVIQDDAGIHARTANKLVKAANTYESDICLARRGQKGNMKHIFPIIALGIRQGDEVTVIIDGADEDEAAETLKKLFEQYI